MPNAKIFLSHASENLPLAGRLADDLSSAGGECFLSDSIPGGEDFTDRLFTEIDRAHVFLALMTGHYVSKSKRGWIHTELSRAFYKSNGGGPPYPIIPVRWDVVDLPHRLKHLQWVRNDGNYAQLLERVIESINSYAAAGKFSPLSKKQCRLAPKQLPKSLFR